MLKNREELLEVIKFGNDIKKVINKWDPMNLIYFDIDDEYETEIKEIRDEIIIKKIMTVNNLSLCIRNIFKNKFSDEYSSKPNIEIEKSKEILDFSKKYNLLDIELDNLKKIEIKIDNKNLDHYMEQYIKIKKIINEWDPLKIMDIALDNEYCNEINDIVNVVNEQLTIFELSKKIHNIFKNSYYCMYNVKKYEEIKIAKKILNSLY